MDLTKMSLTQMMQKANTNIIRKDAEIHVVETSSSQSKELHSTPVHFVGLPAASARSVSVPLSLCPSVPLSLVLSPFSPNKVNECLES